jgi:hypothetical protein
VRRIVSLVALCALAGGSWTVAQERPLPAFDAFVARAKERLRTDAELQSSYTYTERRVEQKLDKRGGVTSETVRVFEVYPRLPGEEEPYRRLVEEDGKPVSPQKLEKQDRQRRKTVEAYVRRAASQTESDRRKAWQAYEKAVEERTREIDDIFNVFDVRMAGRDEIGGHDTIAFTLTPNPGARPRTDSGKMMQHFSARAWISESDYELVRVEVEAVDAVSFGLGLLGRLHEGATASFERRKVNDEVWLPARVAYGGSGRVLLVRTLRRGGGSEFSNYRKYTVDTSTTVDLP